jgi:PAS domain S-box-containing protein
VTVHEGVPATLSDTDEDEIHVVLVDDNEQWTAFMAHDLERASPRLRVTTALSANEAVQELRSAGTVECVVSDYRMPEVDGLQLLERVREERPGLPFVLITGKGSEDVAGRAINAGVSDYIVKDPGSDQTSLFAARIQRSVSEYRLRRAIEESEKRYRTVTEQIAEGIAIVRDGDVVFHNDRLEEVTGYRGEHLETEGFLGRVHPEDRAGMRRHCEGLAVGESTGERPSVRFRRPDGETRFWVYSGQGIRYGGDSATLLSVRDVTDRRRRRRRLEWERDVNRVVHEVLVESRTREILETRLCEVLTEFGYALAWVGLPDGGRLEPRASAGATGFLDDTDRSMTGEHEGRPCLWATRSRTAQFVEDVEELFPTEWRECALEHGLRAGGALPLVHNGVFYGVLVVYRDDPGVDDVERELLEGLVDTLAFGIHTLETSQALASESLVEVTAQVAGRSFYLNEVTARPRFRETGGTVTVRGTLPQESDRVVQYVSVDGCAVDVFREVVGDHPSVEAVRTVSEDRGRVQVTLSGQTPGSRVASLGARVVETTVEMGRTTVRFELPASQDVRAAVEHLGESSGTTTALSVVEADRDGGAANSLVDPEGADLTDKQRNALRVAYHDGYFEQPRSSSATEVAETLGVSHSTFLQHLRVAQRKVFGERFG